MTEATCVGLRVCVDAAETEYIYIAVMCIVVVLVISCLLTAAYLAARYCLIRQQSVYSHQ